MMKKILNGFSIVQFSEAIDVFCFILREVLSSNTEWNQLFSILCLNEALFTIRHFQVLISTRWYIVYDLSLARDSYSPREKMSCLCWLQKFIYVLTKACRWLFTNSF
jgi:hypothetical protein